MCEIADRSIDAKRIMRRVFREAAAGHRPPDDALRPLLDWLEVRERSQLAAQFTHRHVGIKDLPEYNGPNAPSQPAKG